MLFKQDEKTLLDLDPASGRRDIVALQKISKTFRVVSMSKGQISKYTQVILIDVFNFYPSPLKVLDKATPIRLVG